jgi:putative SbcD/Mre11-related phosphoesterase
MKMKILYDSLLVDNEVLIVGDMHIGYEDQFAGRAVFPNVQLKNIISKFNKIFKKLDGEGVKVKQVVILGDLKHEFGGISDQEWAESLKLIDYLGGKVKGNRKEKIVVVEGNHDNMLKPILKKRKGVVFKESYKMGEVCCLHGNKWLNSCLNSKILVMGHLHPAITLSDKYKREKFKCILHGKWKRKEVFVLPSFSKVSLGYELLDVDEDKDYKKGDDFFIINKKSLKKFEVIIYDSKGEKALNFGKLKKLT